MFGAVPFDGGDLLFDLSGTGPFGLDWGLDSGASGEFLMGATGSIPAEGRCRIEPGDNTMMGGGAFAGVRFTILKNGSDTGSGWDIPQGATGSFPLTGPTTTVPFGPGDRIAIRPFLQGAIPPTSGYIRAPRFSAVEVP